MYPQATEKSRSKGTVWEGPPSLTEAGKSLGVGGTVRRRQEGPFSQCLCIAGVS